MLKPSIKHPYSCDSKINFGLNYPSDLEPLSLEPKEQHGNQVKGYILWLKECQWMSTFFPSHCTGLWKRTLDPKMSSIMGLKFKNIYL